MVFQGGQLGGLASSVGKYVNYKVYFSLILVRLFLLPFLGLYYLLLYYFLDLLELPSLLTRVIGL
jgi:hypothetical protein